MSVKLSNGMTEAQADQIRADRQTMKAVDVARKHSVTRQTVYNIMAKAPNEEKRALEIAMGVEDAE